MNLNDPFNRLSRKQHNEYIAFRESIKESTISSQSDIETLLKNIHKRALVIIILIIITAAFVLMLLPHLKVFVTIFSVLALLWLFNISLKGHSYIKRYLKEEFGHQE
ncbi:MAG: hypothetical protein HOM14_06990 [Gammaproteobacteria bacterium]|jgi:hypothetical protein|nr:hypothetical protein [Gammaproteobacteria bacterium]MBT3724948.1 hypothetical protein [Gammaproteobacteria bacterium]MBT4075584.1 hypothetical protein [Gammaproteobacteria bacterium]MBT4194343.1 hypothetical protein [Gammaproteobacteria bacterium]MBT4448597.1 hypothetical protein [Gammaproteobacteria bacterium]